MFSVTIGLIGVTLLTAKQAASDAGAGVGGLSVGMGPGAGGSGRRWRAAHARDPPGGLRPARAGAPVLPGVRSWTCQPPPSAAAEVLRRESIGSLWRNVS